MIKIKDLYEKFMNTKSFVVILIIGVMLLMLPNFFSAKSDAPKDKRIYEIDFEKYQEKLESKLSDMLSKIEGAGNVKVMITLKDSGRHIYSQEEQTEKSETEQRGNLKPVLKSLSSGEEEPILIKTELPKILGVLIVADGAEDAKVREGITNSLKAVLDISTKNISVMAK